jgi:hypothetical protein
MRIHYFGCQTIATSTLVVVGESRTLLVLLWLLYCTALIVDEC